MANRPERSKNANVFIVLGQSNIVRVVQVTSDTERYNQEHAARCERNLMNLSAALREDFSAPNAKVCLPSFIQINKRMILPKCSLVSIVSPPPEVFIGSGEGRSL
jgi:hypothetical protein